MEAGTELFRNKIYYNRDHVEKFLGLAVHRSGFFGEQTTTGVRALDRNKLNFNEPNNVELVIEGFVDLKQIPTNNGAGNIVYTGYGILEVDGVVIYDGRLGTTTAIWGAITGTLSNQVDLQAALDAKADVVHTHVEADITDLDKYTVAQVDTLLNGKADTVHTHVEADITDLDKYTQAEIDAFFEGEDSGKKQVDWARVINTPASFPPDAHTHTLAEITDSGALAAEDTVSTGLIDDEAVTLAKLAHIAQNVILGRDAVGTGDVKALTPAEATSILNTFTDLLQGLVPASGGGTATFLRADGTFAVPPAGSVTNYVAGVLPPQLFNPDASGVSGNTDDFTLAGPQQVILVTHNGQVLDDSEYSLAGAVLTVTPDNGFTAITDEVLVYQATTAASIQGEINAITQVNSTYTALLTDVIIECTSGTFDVDLPSAALQAGQTFRIKNSGAGVITVDPDGAELIDTAAFFNLNGGDSLTIASNGSNWIIL